MASGRLPTRAAMTSLTGPAPEVSCLDEMLARRVAAMPDALAFSAGDERLTFGGLRSAAAALAAAIAGRGVGAGHRVVLLLPAGLDFVRVFFALQRLAAVPHALSPALPAATAARRAARVRPRLVITGTAGGGAGRDLLAAAAAAGLAAVDLSALSGDAGALPVPEPVSEPTTVGGPDSPAFLQATSGTAGEPRAAIILQRNVLASLAAARERLAIGAADVLVGWVPPWHDLGLLRFILGPVYFGVPCHLVAPAVSTIPLWLRTAAAVRATILGAPDFAYRLAVRLVDPAGLDLSTVRYATNGGEPVRRSTIEAFESRFGLSRVVRPGYGLAEATLGVTCLAPGEPLRVDARGNVSCGRPFPGVEVRIAPPTPAEEGARAAAADEPASGVVGEILVRGPGVFAGYFDAGEASREVLREGWLHTGDLGQLDEDGHLYVLGRQRAMLKRGGAPLAPREVEEAAERVAGVRGAAAVGLPAGDAAVSEEIVLVVEAEAPGAAADLAAHVAAAVEAALGFAPDRVLVTSPRSISRTANGKLRYDEIRRALLAGELPQTVL
jgi:acyl-CoA synthetase (AMP-forming)/AMP-acid ligase II